VRIGAAVKDEILQQLTRIRIGSGVGVYESGGNIHRIEVARTLLGIMRVGTASASPCRTSKKKPADAAPTRAQALATAIVRRLGPIFEAARRKAEPLVQKVNASLATKKRRQKAKKGKNATKPAKARVQRVTAGVRASAVTFVSQLSDESNAHGSSDREKFEKTDKGEGKRPNVLIDRVRVTLAKKQVVLTGKVRTDELAQLGTSAGLDPEDPHVFEPAPWAVWRASCHYAPLKPHRGIHLRYVLGATGGVALLATAEWPLAWQLLSWEAGNKEEALIQAFYILNVHAARRLGLPGIDHVSVHGDDALTKTWAEIEAVIGQSITRLEGPHYDADLITFGLALGALEQRTESINLARSVQPDPSLAALAPWGEMGFLVSLFLCMYLVLHAHIDGLKGQLLTARKQNEAVAWAKGQQTPKLKADLNVLEREVTPLQYFLTREVEFSRVMESLASVMPPSTWLVSVNGGDLLWEKNPNKMLGQRWFVVQGGAPAARRGMAPPEINQAVYAIEESDYLGKVLPQVKLTDVNWRQQAGAGYTAFSVLALPK
jgi:hypothetical protein